MFVDFKPNKLNLVIGILAFLLIEVYFNDVSKIFPVNIIIVILRIIEYAPFVILAYVIGSVLYIPVSNFYQHFLQKGEKNA